MIELKKLRFTFLDCQKLFKSTKETWRGIHIFTSAIGNSLLRLGLVTLL